MTDTGNTTNPADPAGRLYLSNAMDAWVPALVICHSIPEPGRTGQITLFDPSITRPFVIGRAGVHFFRQRPGEMIDCGRLKGDTISGEQLLVSCEGDGLRVHNVGRAAVIVDGTRLPQHTSVHVLPGAVVEVYGHSVFLVTRRPLSMPEPHRLLLPLHAFGGPDSMGIVGESLRVWQLRQAIVLAASRGCHVLVFGETGTGKDLVAKAIHLKSVRASGPYVHINCSNLRHGLSSLELFGGRKDWPNPGTPATVGYFNAAEGGTLFLDEIGEMERALQSDLLTALEGGFQVRPEAQRRPTRCVVVAATNRGELGLKEDVRYRFGVVVLTPPLAERREDIGLLAPSLLLKRALQDTEFAKKCLRTEPDGRQHVPVDASLVAGLLRHPLAGNIRDLENFLGTAGDETAAGQPVRWPEDVPTPPPATLDIRKEEPHVTAHELIQGLDAPRKPTITPPAILVREPQVPSGDRPDPSPARVLEVLQETKFNYVKAAPVLGISVDKLFRLRKKYGID